MCIRDRYNTHPCIITEICSSWWKSYGLWITCCNTDFYTATPRVNLQNFVVLKHMTSNIINKEKKLSSELYPMNLTIKYLNINIIKNCNNTQQQ